MKHNKIILFLIIIITIYSTVLSESNPFSSGFSPPDESEFIMSSEVSGTDQEVYENGEKSGKGGGDIYREEFWYHDLDLKILVLVIFSITSVAFILMKKKTVRYRKLILVSSVVVLGFLMGGFLCPVSAVQNIIFKAGSAYLILFSIPLLLSLFFGRVYCGYICPFGALSELVHVKKLRIKVGKKADRILSLIKYFVLVFLLLRLIFSGEIVDGFSPFKDIFDWGGITFNLILSVVFILLSVFFYRPFCKYICPYGALQSVISKFSIFRISAKESCVSCKLCVKSCPMNAIDDKIEINGECLLCGECSSVCKKESICINLPVKTGNKKNFENTDREEIL